MPPRERDQTSSLIRFAEDIGEIRAGVKTLDEGQRRVDKKITGLQRNVADLVTRADCSAHRDEVTERIDTALFAREARGEIPSAAPAPTLLELAGRKAGAIAAILSLVAMLAVGLVVVSRVVASLERAIDRDRKAQAATTRRLIDEVRKARHPAAAPPAWHPDGGIPARRPTAPTRRAD